MSDKDTVTLFFHWRQASADPRQYNQQRTLLDTNYVVAVSIPKTDEYIYNMDALENNDPILTLAGMVYADNQLTSAYRSKEEFDVDVADVEWGDTVDENEEWVDDIDDDEEDLEDVINWEED
jgi:hypothetical protein